MSHETTSASTPIIALVGFDDDQLAVFAYSSFNNSFIAPFVNGMKLASAWHANWICGLYRSAGHLPGRQYAGEDLTNDQFIFS